MRRQDMRGIGWCAARGAVLAPILALSLASGAQASDPPAAVVAFVIDTSGSVGRVGLARARELGERALASLPAGGEGALFTFDDQPRLLLERTSNATLFLGALERATVAGRH